MNKFYTKFTDDKYLSKKNIIKILGKNYNEIVWNNVKEYRFHYAHKIPVKTISGNKIYLVLTPKIMLKESNIIKKLSKLSTYVHKYIALSNQNKELMSYKDFTQQELLKEVVSFSETSKQPVTLSSMSDIINKKSYPSNEDELAAEKIYKILHKSLTNKDNKIPVNEIVSAYKDLTNLHQVPTNNFRAKKFEVTENFKGLISFLNLECDYSFLTKAAIAFYAIKNNKFFEKYNDLMAFVIFYRTISKYGYQEFIELLKIAKNCFDNGNISLEAAFQESNNYQGDVTYLLNVFIEAADMSINNFEKTFEKLLNNYSLDENKISILEMELATKNIVNKNPFISYRQAKFFINHNDENVHYDLNHFRNFAKCSYETARYSMDNLVNHKFYNKEKIGKKFIYKIKNNDEV